MTSTATMIRAHEATLGALAAVDLDEIGRAVSLLEKTYHCGGAVFCVGNGGSAATASHFAADLGKYATGGALGFRAMDLVGNYASHTAWTNDESWEATWTEMLRPWVRKGDVVVAFSVHGGSGWSSNLVRALTYARETGAATLGFSGDGGGMFGELCDVSVVVPTSEATLVTPITEGLHSVIAHLVVAELRRRIPAA
ncbi:SIS domain protein [Propionibacterium acidifaciens F0233]|uniref:SIS domain protein n=1 Tax=Propionibacterium acidifaciens F0233 TaxID=553198 RepID=U2QYW7_9ACTN|nr:SIS domain-containing protein [Propionibacterium acidifaciens]AYW76949.1 SIS domain-containing protein [Propionibacterium acidifaciens]ERK61731.1 SIS domain protein [Propionibacterium acidifaciens F0233]